MLGNCIVDKGGQKVEKRLRSAGRNTIFMKKRKQENSRKHG
jgi:hypothetical protein